MTPRLKGKPQLLICILLVIIVLVFILHHILSNFNSERSKIPTNVVNKIMVPYIKLENFFPYQKNEEGNINYMAYRDDPPIFEPFKGEILIHLDLKGAPPLPSYYKTFFPFIKNLGATGILIEYEDVYPYEDDLEEIKAENAYTPSDIKNILNMAMENNLSVVPLIQTFGHFEFVLKLQNYRELREIDEYPQVLCPSHIRTKNIVYGMIKQIILAHPQAKYIHIGCDEVYYLGECDTCLNVMEVNNWDKYYLFLNHVSNIVTHINNTYPGIRPILWGDMFAKIDKQIIKKFKIHEMADLMIWKYTTNVSEYITNDMLNFYAQHFKSIWIASAFKGATGPNQILTDAIHHLTNHMSWIDIVSKWKDRINFKGIALTGWQRYDHFATLCELLPVSIPSLTLSLLYLKGIKKDFHESKLLEILQCDTSIPFFLDDVMQIPKINCDFPGFPIYQIINKFYSLTRVMNHPDASVADGWFSLYNVVYKFSSPVHIQDFIGKWPSERYLEELKYMEKKISKRMSQVYDEHTVNEWLLTFVTPLQMRLKAYFLACRAILEQGVWPRRPLVNGTKNLQKAMSKICTFNKELGCGLLLP